MGQLGKSDMLQNAIQDIKDAPIDSQFSLGPREGEITKPEKALDFIQALADNKLDKTPLIANKVP